VLAVVLLLPLVLVALMPLTLWQRYRAGTARRLAREWLATINMLGLVLSSALFLIGAATTSFWVPDAFTYALVGLAGGCALGVLGLLSTRWDRTPRGLYYTPSRVLVLGITLVVTSRLLYGFWRAWHAWGATPDASSWLVASGAAGSLAAGAIVIGYYLSYWSGVRYMLKQHRAGVSRHRAASPKRGNV
jgi:hypothetical protein